MSRSTLAYSDRFNLHRNWGGNGTGAPKVFSLYPAEETPRQVREAVMKYAGLLGYAPGWDGHDGKPISSDSFLFGIQMLCQTLPQGMTASPQIVPLSYGGIQIEWHTLNGDLEIEIERPMKFSGFFEDARTGEQVEFEGSNHFGQIAGLLMRL